MLLRRRLLLRLAAATVAATTLATLAVQQPASAAVMPGGRGKYVVAIMGDSPQPGRSYVRLAMYDFRTTGTVRMDYWSWNQSTLVKATRTGFRTNGCAHDCGVFTSEGFEAAPKALFGTWTWNASNDLIEIVWSTGQAEQWRYTHYDNITKLDLHSATIRPTVGWGWGSTTPYTTFATMDQVKAAGRLNVWGRENNYGQQSGPRTSSLSLGLFSLCNATCLALGQPANAVAKYYLAGGNAASGRKLYWNVQRYATDPAPCIGQDGNAPGAGHLDPALQIIDDTGRFRGMIVVEASVYSFKVGSAIMGIQDMNNILPAP